MWVIISTGVPYGLIKNTELLLFSLSRPILECKTAMLLNLKKIIVFSH